MVHLFVDHVDVRSDRLREPDQSVGVGDLVAARPTAHAERDERAAPEAVGAIDRDAQGRAAVGVDVKTFLEPLGEGALEGFVQRNVNLIVTVPERYFARLQGDTENAFLTGRHPNDLARDLEERYEMSQRDAMRIARDQTGKLYNQVNRERQQQLGVTEFIWRTSGTNLVCDDCGSMEGERCSYENPPDIGLPGESHIMCMCYEEPVLDDLLGDIGMDLGEESSAEAPVAEEVTPDEEQGDEGQGM